MTKHRLPYMPFWVDDYQRDTRHLTTEEHGAYLLLLMAAWASPTNSLPDDDDMLARVAGVSTARWRKMKAIVMAFWSLDGRSKRWSQKRLKKERRLAVDRKAKASDAAASRWKDRKKGDAKAMLEQCHPSITIKGKPNGFLERATARKKTAEMEIMGEFTDV
ncbi:DUF1376 domain-containing protein [Mesorhizobium sp. B2-3-3]|nr:DUF1376 domain-containing protein [Mesorhizobium sp. B2-3-3]